MSTTLPMFELKKIQSSFPCETIRSSRDAERFARLFYGDDIDIFESAFILTLNRANYTTGFAKISQGGVFATVIDPRLVCKYAIESMALNIILFHNHPSGSLSPSNTDDKLTQDVANVLGICGIRLFDHIILAPEKGRYYSYADDNRMPEPKTPNFL